jgi:hypothetical protein
LWCRIFGTYAAEGEKVIYGITTPIGSHNLLIIKFKGYGPLFRDIKSAKSWRPALGYLFHAPDWRPKTARQIKQG